MSDNNKHVEFAAYKKWLGIPEEYRVLLLANALCGNCGVTSFAPGFAVGSIPGGDIVISGKCYKCGESIARCVECDDESCDESSSLMDVFNEDEMDEDYNPFPDANPMFKEYLEEFRVWLEKSKISHRTVEKHMDNVSFYVLHYLGYYEPCEDIADGCMEIGMYLGDFFIRKCMWSSKTAIKDAAAGIKKFYKCMLENGHVAMSDYELLCENIKREMPEWLERCDDFMNSSDNLEDWFW